MSLSLALTALLGPAHDAAAVPAPAPSVELRMTSVDDGAAMLLEQLLLRRLGDRLLEDGYTVVPIGQRAGVRVWIHLDGNGARIEARGTEHRVETVKGGDPQVVALEIQQLTTALIDAVQPRDGAGSAAVVLELVGEGHDRELRERLQAGLLARGFALTRRPSAGDVRVCVAGDVSSAGVVVYVVAGEASCEPRPDAPSMAIAGADAVELQREHVLDGTTALLHAWASSPANDESQPIANEPPAELEPEPEPEPPAPAEPTPTDTRERMSVTLEVHGGLAARFGGPDGSVGARVRGGRQKGIGGALELDVIPSRAAGVKVVEYLPTAALDWRIGLGKRALVALAAHGGLHLHAYRQTAAGGQRGVRLGPSVGASAGLGYLGPRGLLVIGGVRGGWSGGRWVHVDNGTSTWRRGGVLVGVELGFGWDFALGHGGGR